MLTEKQIEEIREHLEKAQNPIFYYDNDADGLSSYLILRRYVGRGSGVVVRSYPALDASYARKAQELNADYVFIVDKPVVSREFVEEMGKIGLPVVWIDHHPLEDDFEKEFDNLFIYNPTRNSGKDKSSEPVSYLAYKITGRKEDLWISIAGCIADHFLPDFAPEFAERYPEFWGEKIEEPFDAYYGSEIGRVAHLFNFSLKDSITHVVAFQKFLIGAKGPQDVLSEAEVNTTFMKKASEIRRKYEELLEKAQKSVSGKMIFFDYGGESSISSEVSNRLSYLNRDKYIVVLRRNEGILSISMRGDNVRAILEKALKKFKHGTGGGHMNAVGARLKVEDLEEFKKVLEEEING